MEETGRCYCGELRYSVRGSLEGSLQGHCRECQYITVGNPNVAVVFALEDFKFTEGLSAKLAQSDLETPVVRHFCANSGTGTGSRSPALPNSMLAKVDTFNNQSFFYHSWLSSTAINRTIITSLKACPPIKKSYELISDSDKLTFSFW